MVIVESIRCWLSGVYWKFWETNYVFDKYKPREYMHVIHVMRTLSILIILQVYYNNKIS